MTDMRELWDTALDQVKNNWCQGRMVNDQGQHCILGAIGYAYYGEMFNESAEGRVDASPLLITQDPLLITQDTVPMSMARRVRSVIEEQYPTFAECFPAGSTQSTELHLVWLFNDNHTHEQVVAVMEKAANQ